ncbi:MAG: DUF2066 domain-containing protein [Proteobacteria bacterium]|nr:DUF2066 domain-containing protein [Pseudomonadota bacterium]MDA1063472.1 DUF2066 domain-containing protein [Pseudomonadota bacterium]
MCLLLSGALLAAFAAQAVEVAALYTAQVALDAEAEDPREQAYETALLEVLLRVAGSELSADREKVALLFPNPAAYVVQFRPGDDDTLWVSFDGEAIESMLRQTGQTVWGDDRPVTLVWLAVDWGQGDREIITADDPERTPDEARSIDRNRLLRQRVLDMAEQRGLPVLFPLLDTEDLQNVGFSDIWGGFDDPLLAASARYDVDSILVGRIRPATGQRNRWNYYFGGEERSWEGEPEAVIGQVADLLASEFAVSGSAPLQTVQLSVSGIDSVDAYAAIQHMLAATSVIESFSVKEVFGDRVRYGVEARGGAERLRRALRFNGLIEQNGMDDEALEFFYSP